MSAMRIRWYGPIAVGTGYAEAGQGYLAALIKASVEVDIVPLFEGDTKHLGPQYEHLLEHTSKKPNDWATHVVVHNNPFAACMTRESGILPPTSPGVKYVCVTTGETDRINENEASGLNRRFDHVIVPSEYNLRAFTKAGVKKLSKIPHTFDPKWWWGEDVDNQRSPFQFYSIFVWRQLKNPLGVLAPYLTAFNGHDRVNLTLVCTNPDLIEIEKLKRSIAEVKGNYSFASYEIKPWIDPVGLRELHQRSHCYLSPHRGEGWGLGAFEAAITGNTVIATYFSGTMDFLTDYPRHKPVRYTKVNVIPDKDFATGIDETHQVAQPNLAEFTDHMVNVYKGGSWQRCIRHRKDFEAKFGHDAVGQQFKQVLEAL